MYVTQTESKYAGHIIKMNALKMYIKHEDTLACITKGMEQS